MSFTMRQILPRRLLAPLLPRPRLYSTQASTPDADAAAAAAAAGASPSQETENVREIHKLMAQVRSTYPQRLKVRMPTRLAPRRSWATEVQSGPEARPVQITPQLEAELLKPKRMQDSYVELYLPFSEDPELLERYIATSGLIRLGKVLEDLDTLAGNISYQHAIGSLPRAGDGSAPIYIVTASVDRLDLLEPLVAQANYRLSGHVIYVGSSSMEVFVQIERLGAVPTVCLTGRFTMAARNASTLKSQQIAPLSISTPAERGLFAIGEQHKKRKRAEAAASLARVPPTKEEAHLLHARYLDQRAATPVSRTGLESTIHMHPQVRNVHQKVFGGFLMRSAYELAWMVAASFVNKPVQYLSLDALAFHAPVPIGAMLRLSSQVTYTSEPSADEPCIAGVSVLAQVVDLETGEYKRSNTFHFSFDLGDTAHRVAPETYAEAMEWIEGKRRVEFGAEMRAMYETK